MAAHYDILNNYAISNGYIGGWHMCASLGLGKAMDMAGFRYSYSEFGGPSYWYHKGVGMYKDVMKEDPIMAKLCEIDEAHRCIRSMEEQINMLRDKKVSLFNELESLIQ